MARSLILLVSAHAQRLLEHCAALHEAGHCLTVPAPTLDRALALLSTVRPALVVYDAATKTYRAADASTPANAVRVTAARDAKHQNTVSGFFSRLASMI